MSANNLTNDSACQELLANLFDSSANRLYSHGMDCISVLNIAATVASMWAMFRHTPTEMTAYRWHLLNVALGAFFVDTWNSMLFMPFYYTPSSHPNLLIVSASIALLGYLGRCVSLHLIGSFNVALICAFLHRYCSIVGRLELFSRKPVIVGIVLTQITYLTPGSIMYAIYMNNFYTGEENTIFDACPSDLGYMVMRIDKYVYNSFHFFCIAFNTICCLALIYITLNALKEARTKITMNTYKYQRRLNISLTLQFVIPFVLMATTYSICWTAIFLRLPTVPVISRYSFLISCLHTTINAIVMLTTIKPYREAVLQKLAKIAKMINSARVNPTNSH